MAKRPKPKPTAPELLLKAFDQQAECHRLLRALNNPATLKATLANIRQARSTAMQLSSTMQTMLDIIKKEVASDQA